MSAGTLIIWGTVALVFWAPILLYIAKKLKIRARSPVSNAIMAGGILMISLFLSAAMLPIVSPVLMPYLPTDWVAGGTPAGEVSPQQAGVVTAELPLKFKDRKSGSSISGTVMLFDKDMMSEYGGIYPLIDAYEKGLLGDWPTATLSSGTATFYGIKGSPEGIVYWWLYIPSSYAVQQYPIAYGRVVVYDKIDVNGKFYQYDVVVEWPDIFKNELTNTVRLYQMTNWTALDSGLGEDYKYNWTDLGTDKKLTIKLSPEDLYNCTYETYIYIAIDSNSKLRDVRMGGKSLNPKAISQLDPMSPLSLNAASTDDYVCLVPIPPVYYGSSTDRAYVEITLWFDTPSSGTGSLNLTLKTFAASEKAVWTSGTIYIYFDSSRTAGWWGG